MAPINLHIPLDVQIHQHDGDPDGEFEVSVGDGILVMCQAPAVAGRIRQLVNQQVKTWELPSG